MAAVVVEAEVASLVDRLVNLSGPSGCVDKNLTSVFGAGRIAVGSPQILSHLSEKLVKLGSQALPQLIASLSDNRRTRLTFRCEGAIVYMYLTNQYDARHGDGNLVTVGCNSVDSVERIARM
jgi:hypothetical protein